MSYGYIGDPLVNFNPNNPFLDMLAAIDEPQEGGVQAGQPPPAAEAAMIRFKLLEFWPHDLGIWFSRASPVELPREDYA
jgi:hypothetical protein